MISVPVKVIGEDRTTQGKVIIQSWVPKERLLRAARILGLFWGAAGLAVFIPVAHFILVPSLALLGPIAALMVYHQQSVVLGGTVECPGCGQSFPVARTGNKWPLYEVCNHCRYRVTVEK